MTISLIIARQTSENCCADFQNYFTVQMERTEIEDQKQDKGEAVSAENETKATREQLVEKTDPTLNSENSKTPVSENSPKCGDSEDKNDDSKNGTSCNCMLTLSFIIYLQYTGRT
jgi:hypothetical protein